MAKKPPTKEDKERYAKLTQLGCYIGQNYAEKVKDYKCGGRLEIHHIRRMGAKTDNRKSFCLCTYHHSAQTPLPHGYAVHKSTKIFEGMFEKQEIILKKINKQLEELCY
jgi:hypothetical protein